MSPRSTLSTCIEYRVFDDIPIDNFARATLHGKQGTGALYPDFGPFLTKYGDAARARPKS